MTTDNANMLKKISGLLEIVCRQQGSLIKAIQALAGRVDAIELQILELQRASATRN